MGEPSAVAVYARISSDQDGTALGVKRQVADCRGLAESLGWSVAEEYVDNDVSAYSGKKRPAYERMLADLRAGVRDAVIVYHADRLTRRPIELEQFVDVVTTAGVRHVRFVAGGELDPGNGDGLLVLRMLAAVAANESASKSRRIRRKNDELAAAGRPHCGASRPFGFADDKITHRPEEAKIVRELVARFLAGESLRSLTAWLNDEEIPAASGGRWRTTTVGAMLRSGRIAGLREHRGEVVGPAVWDPIISTAERDRVLAVMEQKKHSGRREPQRYLLSGLCRCSKCGHRLLSSSRTTGRRYVCLSGPDHGGCGGITVTAEPLEMLVKAAVLYRLDTPDLADVIAGQASLDAETAALSEGLSADRALLDELAGMFAAREITSREWMAAKAPIQLRVEQTERQLAQRTGNDTLAGVVGQGVQLEADWEQLSLDRRHAVIRALVDHVVIGPGRAGSRGLDPSRVEIMWRL